MDSGTMDVIILKRHALFIQMGQVNIRNSEAEAKAEAQHRETYSWSHVSQIH